MASGIAKECGVCTEEYDERERCPRILPCYHSLCSACISDVIQNNSKSCPFCRHGFDGKAATEFRVNNDALELMKYIKDLEFKASQPSCSQQPRGMADMRSLRLDEMKKDALELNSISMAQCQEAQDEIKTLMHDNKELFHRLQRATDVIEKEILLKINKIASRNKRQMEYLEQDNKKLESKLESMVETHKDIGGVRRNIEAGESMKKVALAVAEAEDINSSVQKKVRKLRSYIATESKIRQIIEKTFTKTSENVLVIQQAITSLEEDEDSDDDDDDDDDNNDDDETDAEDKDSDIQVIGILSNKKVKVQHPTQSTVRKIPLVHVENLHSMTLPVRNLFEQGRMYAVQELGGRRRYARISISDKNYLCLHHLSSEIVTPNSHVLQHRDLMNMVSPSSRLAFVELKSLSSCSFLGKIYIRLTPHSLRGENFLLMCSGELGPSYANTNLLCVSDLGCDGEFLWCGDYEQNDGFGGKALVPGAGSEVGGALRKSWCAGAVSGGSLVDDYAAHFLIYTKNSPGGFLDQCFGHIERGLDILSRAVASHSNIRDVVISDCGVVLCNVST